MIIDIQHVSWDRNDKKILQDISWTVQSGEHWCLLGLNGSGKTTLLNMINGYIWPTEGSMSILGKKFGEFDLRELRKSIGWVSTSLQQKLYGSETALKIVLSGKFATIGLYDFTNNEDIRQAEALMKSLGCTALMDRTYDTLSQGERQRVLIARALMAAPKLLILDEPCTGLDVFAREQLLQMIAAVAAEKEAPTIIYVTHHVEEILPCFTKTLLIKEGEVFAAMDTSETLTSALMSDFFAVPVEIQRRDGRNWLSVNGELWN
ncbi:molybdenum ABC transporter ATP-binding protein [Paenibacillus sp. FSL H8-0548]|uniref:ABC transporter ATP-binding protein n=1 Tax=Paenibacillus sp. FSL H8-0548 TaxID=1920422 RepID=UPI00096D37B2|nr:ABC transporter ATP-binding protein [Paenibacillus sp. FSL H8-0548]OMF34210.1 molybdenum ABC transporter ATP-binding protein [Paenibacillus sp. FSL H8-0548]